MMDMLKQPIQLIPEYRDYVWGGSRLRPGIVPTAEAWIVYEGDRVAGGEYAGRTLHELVLEFGSDLLGKNSASPQAGRFPVLVKLLDCAEWLSLQVHPDDVQAAALEGSGFFGKTEAWHVLSSVSGSTLIAGMQAGTSAGSLADSIRNGTILERVQTLSVQTGDTLLIRPGTIHALGPGLLIYEIQQTSDLTYRVYDWGRPQTEKRKLHIEKALAVSRPDAGVELKPAPELGDGEIGILSHCQYFNLEIISALGKTVELDTLGESFHALTAIEGHAQILIAGQVSQIKPFETILVPAVCGAYRIKPLGNCRILKARL